MMANWWSLKENWKDPRVESAACVSSAQSLTAESLRTQTAEEDGAVRGSEDAAWQQPG